jgi:hypothetical protein
MKVTDVKDGNHDNLGRKGTILRRPEIYNERNTEKKTMEFANRKHSRRGKNVAQTA